MKRVSFLHSDISRIKFINTKWGKDFRIFDEKLFLLKLNKKEFIKEQRKFLKKIISVKLDDIIKAFGRRNVAITEEMEEIIYEPAVNQILEKSPKRIIISIIEENKNEVWEELEKNMKGI
jgi:primase-polymerase (primpol)-like protein